MATSKLQKYTGKRLRKLFGKYGVEENRRPDWLISSHGERLELDFYIEKLGVAVEVQGRQHLEYCPHFHQTEWDFEQQRRRDLEKAEICAKAGITLLEVFNKDDVAYVLAEIDRGVRDRLESDDWVLNHHFQGISYQKFSKGVNSICALISLLDKQGYLTDKSTKKLAQLTPMVITGLRELGYELPGSEKRMGRKLEAIDRAHRIISPPLTA